MDERILYGSTFHDYEKYPELKEETLWKLENDLSSEMDIYTVQYDVLNEFLKAKFENNLGEFMRMYLKKHLTSANSKDIETVIRIHSIPKKICLFVKEAYSPNELWLELKNYQSTIISGMFGESKLNLHNDDVYKLTLIHAKFDLKPDKNAWFGYFFNTPKHMFFIKSSIQFDLTIVYYEI